MCPSSLFINRIVWLLSAMLSAVLYLIVNGFVLVFTRLAYKRPVWTSMHFFFSPWISCSHSQFPSRTSFSTESLSFLFSFCFFLIMAAHFNSQSQSQLAILWCCGWSLAEFASSALATMVKTFCRRPHASLMSFSFSTSQVGGGADSRCLSLALFESTSSILCCCKQPANCSVNRLYRVLCGRATSPEPHELILFVMKAKKKTLK